MTEQVARFVVYGPPVGYYTHGKVPNRRRLTKYVEYKRLVQVTAKVAGVDIPLTATRTDPLIIRTRAYFKHGTHPDPENIHKGIVDALFYPATRRGKGVGDKYTGGSFNPPVYDAARPRVEIMIERAIRCTSR